MYCRQHTLLFLLAQFLSFFQGAQSFVASNHLRNPGKSLLILNSDSDDSVGSGVTSSPPTSDDDDKQDTPAVIDVGVRDVDPSTMTTEQLMAAIGTSPRRIFLSLSSAAGIALAGNLFGVTSKLLEVVPEPAVEASGLDTYFPRGKAFVGRPTVERCSNYVVGRFCLVAIFLGDFKRVKGRGYTFLIPKEWVADTFVELAKAQQRTRSLDYQMTRPPRNSMLPDSGRYSSLNSLIDCHVLIWSKSLWSPWSPQRTWRFETRRYECFGLGDIGYEGFFSSRNPWLTHKRC